MHGPSKATITGSSPVGDAKWILAQEVMQYFISLNCARGAKVRVLGYPLKIKKKVGNIMKDLKIFTYNIEGTAVNQIHELLKQEAFSDAKVRIMPDVHAGKGCVIGFTADLGDKVIPNIVGVDIGCGMLTIDLGYKDIDLEQLDKVIREKVPSGFNVHQKIQETPFKLTELFAYDKLRNKMHIEKSVGTLGGGNHFIEVDEDEKGRKYLIIHSGSRNLGKQIADIYQNIAIEQMTKASEDDRRKVIDELKSQNRQSEIPDALKALTPTIKIPKELAYLENEDRENYLHDMMLCQVYASENRKRMAYNIITGMGWNIKLDIKDMFETIHNYIGKDNIVRKGAISAYEDEIVLIPINMRDGCIIARGKGNKDWNYSAPHGAGRIMSRGEAKRTLDFDEYQKSMEGIYSTSVLKSTLDEAPMVYKPMEEIIENIKDTVEIIKIIKPIYNFKAN